MKIAFDLKEKRPVVVGHQELTGGRYLSSESMSQRQRNIILRELMTIDSKTAVYLNEHTTNRVKEFQKLHHNLIQEKEELTTQNMFRLLVYMQDVRFERIFREV
jgi:hypothetical protein